METRTVTPDVVQTHELPEVVPLYKVMSVAKTVIDDDVQISGDGPDGAMLRRVLQIVGAEDVEEAIQQVHDLTTRVERGSAVALWLKPALPLSLPLAARQPMACLTG